MSLATTKKKFIPELLDLCERAFVQNAILVVSKRNFGDFGYPAMFSSVVSVDCEAFKDKYKMVRYLKSRIQYGARGRDVKVLEPGGSYTHSSGTSFATPHVTGIAALLVSIFPDISSYQLKTVLDKFSEKLFCK
jgi:subtilisin family serine protease